jgi:chaperone modulatory protein CbpM
MITFEAVIRTVRGIEPRDLDFWIAERWVRPDGSEGAWLFREVDVARIHLIVELRRDLAIDDDHLPVVLRLVDQVYALRRRLRSLTDAVEAQPMEARAAILKLLGDGGTEE